MTPIVGFVLFDCRFAFFPVQEPILLEKSSIPLFPELQIEKCWAAVEKDLPDSLSFPTNFEIISIWDSQHFSELRARGVVWRDSWKVSSDFFLITSISVSKFSGFVPFMMGSVVLNYAEIFFSVLGDSFQKGDIFYDFLQYTWAFLNPLPEYLFSSSSCLIFIHYLLFCRSSLLWGRLWFESPLSELSKDI